MTMLDRRGFLRAAGIAAVGVATACGADSATPNTHPSDDDLSLGPSTEPPPPSGPPDWSRLASSMEGSLVLPDDDGYDTARLLYNTRFDDIRPAAVARCASADDVVECVRFARDSGVALVPRSGGHSYAGWSTGTGLVIDTGPIAAIHPGRGQAVIGSGARLVDVYATLGAAGVGVPAGSCPTVGITGLTLGGGQGVLTRAWGLTCDNLLSADVVTAAGDLITCDPDHDRELYWALRGGGGGNFGIVTSLTLRTRPARSLSMEFLSWPVERAVDVVAGWQSWLPGTPNSLWANVHLLTDARGRVNLTANAFVLDDPDVAASLVDGLVDAVGHEPSSRSNANQPYSEAMMRLAGCQGKTVPQCHLPSQNPEGQLTRETYTAKSHILNQALSADGIETLVEGIHDLGQRTDAGTGGAQIDSMGGAVSDLARDDTAFPHRAALANIQYLVSWSNDSLVDGSLEWIRDLHGRMNGFADGAYVNYIDPDLEDWQHAYYGDNYDRLRQVKASYDPDGIFTFPQTIEPAEN